MAYQKYNGNTGSNGGFDKRKTPLNRNTETEEKSGRFAGYRPKKAQEQGTEERTYDRKPDSEKNRFRSEDDRKNSYRSSGKSGYGNDSRRKPEQDRGASQSPAVMQADEDVQPYLIIGRNAVREAIRADRSIDRILVTKESDGSLSEIIKLAKEHKLVIREVDRKKLDELCMPFGHGGKTANHQGIVAYAAGVEYCTVEDILACAKEKGEEPFVVVLDGIEDPHNLGSIIRSAECAGAHGVVIGKRRCVPVTAAAVKASAGACEYVKIARVVNISAALQELKKAGCWVAGADMNGQPMGTQNLSGALALVIGNEGDGLSKLVRDNCDMTVSIPMRGHIDSLNAGVAAAILMFEKRRQDG